MNYKDALQNNIFKIISQSARELNIKSFVIGGYVRDYILNRGTHKDIDIVAIGSGIELARKVAQNLPNKPKVQVFKTNIFNGKNKKTKNFLTFGSIISKITENKNFIEFEKNKWIRKKDIKNVYYKEKNYLKIFKLFLKTKYVWGGKTFNGIDCSALLQLFYYYNQKFYPRDTKDQIKYSKKINRTFFKKGDIIFWKGHVAMCINSKQLIHAYGPEKRVLIMPIIKTIKRIEKTAKLKVIKISSIKY